MAHLKYVKLFIGIFYIFFNHYVLAQKAFDADIFNLKKNTRITQCACIESFNIFTKKLEELRIDNLHNLPSLEENICIERNYYQQGKKVLAIIKILEEKTYKHASEELAALADITLNNIYDFFCLKLLSILATFDYHQSTLKQDAAHVYYALYKSNKADLAKLAIIVLMIKFSDFTYAAKQNLLFTNAERCREQLIETNTSTPSVRINTSDIHNFINLIQSQAIQKPLVTSDKINAFAKTTIAVLLIGGVVCYALNKEAPKWMKKKCTEIFGGIMDFLGPSYLGEHAVNEAKKNLGDVVAATENIERIAQTIQQGLAQTQQSVAHAATIVAATEATVARVTALINDPASHTSRTLTRLADVAEQVATSVNNASHAVSSETPLARSIAAVSTSVGQATTYVKGIPWKKSLIAAGTTLVPIALYHMGLF